MLLNTRTRPQRASSASHKLRVTLTAAAIATTCIVKLFHACSYSESSAALSAASSAESSAGIPVRAVQFSKKKILAFQLQKIGSSGRNDNEEEEKDSSSVTPTENPTENEALQGGSSGNLANLAAVTIVRQRSTLSSLTSTPQQVVEQSNLAQQPLLLRREQNVQEEEKREQQEENLDDQPESLSPLAFEQQLQATQSPTSPQKTDSGSDLFVANFSQLKINQEQSPVKTMPSGGSAVGGFNSSPSTQKKDSNGRHLGLADRRGLRMDFNGQTSWNVKGLNVAAQLPPQMMITPEVRAGPLSGMTMSVSNHVSNHMSNRPSTKFLNTKLLKVNFDKDEGESETGKFQFTSGNRDVTAGIYIQGDGTNGSAKTVTTNTNSAKLGLSGYSAFSAPRSAFSAQAKQSAQSSTAATVVTLATKNSTPPGLSLLSGTPQHGESLFANFNYQNDDVKVDRAQIESRIGSIHNQAVHTENRASEKYSETYSGKQREITSKTVAELREKMQGLTEQHQMWNRAQEQYFKPSPSMQQLPATNAKNSPKQVLETSPARHMEHLARRLNDMSHQRKLEKSEKNFNGSGDSDTITDKSDSEFGGDAQPGVRNTIEENFDGVEELAQLQKSIRKVSTDSFGKMGSKLHNLHRLGENSYGDLLKSNSSSGENFNAEKESNHEGADHDDAAGELEEVLPVNRPPSGAFAGLVAAQPTIKVESRRLSGAGEPFSKSTVGRGPLTPRCGTRPREVSFGSGSEQIDKHQPQVLESPKNRESKEYPTFRDDGPMLESYEQILTEQRGGLTESLAEDSSNTDMGNYVTALTPGVKNEQELNQKSGSVKSVEQAVDKNHAIVQRQRRVIVKPLKKLMSKKKLTMEKDAQKLSDKSEDEDKSEHAADNFKPDNNIQVLQSSTGSNEEPEAMIPMKQDRPKHNTENGSDPNKTESDSDDLNDEWFAARFQDFLFKRRKQKCTNFDYCFGQHEDSVTRAVLEDALTHSDLVEDLHSQDPLNLLRLERADCIKQIFARNIEARDSLLSKQNQDFREKENEKALRNRRAEPYYLGVEHSGRVGNGFVLPLYGTEKEKRVASKKKNWTFAQIKMGHASKLFGIFKEKVKSQNGPAQLQVEKEDSHHGTDDEIDWHDDKMQQLSIGKFQLTSSDPVVKKDVHSLFRFERPLSREPTSSMQDLIAKLTLRAHARVDTSEGGVLKNSGVDIKTIFDSSDLAVLQAFLQKLENPQTLKALGQQLSNEVAEAAAKSQAKFEELENNGRKLVAVRAGVQKIVNVKDISREAGEKGEKPGETNTTTRFPRDRIAEATFQLEKDLQEDLKLVMSLEQKLALPARIIDLLRELKSGNSAQLGSPQREEKITDSLLNEITSYRALLLGAVETKRKRYFLFQRQLLLSIGRERYSAKHLAEWALDEELKALTKIEDAVEDPSVLGKSEKSEVALGILEKWVPISAEATEVNALRKMSARVEKLEKRK